MHTCQAEDGAIFHFNPDLSGRVVIGRGAVEVEISADDLVEFINHVTSRRLARASDGSWYLAPPGFGEWKLVVGPGARRTPAPKIPKG